MVKGGTDRVFSESELLEYLGNKRGGKACSMKNKKNMVGGGSSDYSGSFHAYTADPSSLSRYTLSNINNTPLFNPFNSSATFATGTSGIIPTGQYYMGPMSNSLGLGSSGMGMSGGSKKSSNAWVNHVKKCCDKYGLTYKEALSDPRTKRTYLKK
jgi:hypothetical protein